MQNELSLDGAGMVLWPNRVWLGGSFSVGDLSVAGDRKSTLTGLQSKGERSAHESVKLESRVQCQDQLDPGFQ